MNASTNIARTKASTKEAGEKQGRAAAPLVIRASAGTGKTYRLTKQLILLLMQGAPVDSFLATTFTRKAAGEILQRLMQRLAAAALEPQGLAELNEMIAPAAATSDDAARVLHQLCLNVGRARICTLDSFFSQIARGFGPELGLPAGWRMADPAEEQTQSRRAVGATVADLPSDKLRTLIAMLAKGEVRRSITNDINGVVQNSYDLFRRSDAKAWQALRVPSGVEQADITRAFGLLETADIGHKSANGQLRKLVEDYQSEDFERVLCHGLVQRLATGETTYYKKQLDVEVIAACEALTRAATVHILSLIRNQTLATHDILAAYDEAATAERVASRVYSFNDITFLIARWLSGERGRPASHADLAFRLDASVEHLLLDEFQDTAPLQWKVLEPIARHVTGRPGRTFFCVGDTKQAIYRWRGGEAAIFTTVEQQLPNVATEQMNRSFRSSPVVIDSVNGLFENLGKHPRADELGAALRDFSDAFPPHSAAHDLPGFVTLQTGPKGTGTAEESSDLHDDFVARRVQQLHTENPHHSIGVLTRTNRSVGSLIFRLRQLNLYVSQEGGNPLTDSAAVDLVLSALRLADSPGDRRWWYHLRHSPLADTLEITDERSASGAAQTLRRRLATTGLATTVRHLAAQLRPYCDSRDQLRLNQLIELALAHDARPLGRWLQFIELVETKRIAAPQEAPIRVMTVHQAKGLEFDTVVLPELDGALTRPSTSCVGDFTDRAGDPTGVLHYVSKELRHALPARWQQAFTANDDGSVTEALCLLYVAVTRPRHALQMLIQPAAKPAFENKTAAALLFHAIGTGDPTAPLATLYAHGDPRWYDQLDRATGASADEAAPQSESRRVSLHLAPPSKKPKRGFIIDE